MSTAPTTGPSETRSTPASPADHPGAAGDARKLGGIVIGLTLLLSLMLALFAWPGANTAPRSLPVGVAAPAPVAAQISSTLEAKQPGAFAVTSLADRTAAVTAIKNHEVYGAIVVGATGPEVLTASAASPMAAQLLGQLGTALAAAQGATAKVTDVVPLSAGDPRGAGLGAGLLPIILGGMACAMIGTQVLRRRSDRLVLAATFSLVGGFAMAAILHFWLGTLEGSYVMESLVLALAIAAISFTILGLESVFGLAGVGLGALTMMILGNALSGAASAPEMLPTGWGAFGQLLPPGATNTLIRSVSFFDGAGAARPTIVLGCWLVFGIVLAFLAQARRRGASRTD